MDALTDTALAKFQQQGSAQIHPVILSGGAGTRLWPLSRAAYPKQLLPLVSERTLLQETAARNLSDVGFAAPLLICNEDHRFLVDEQLRQVGIEPQAILLEPIARNTGPAIAAAALWLLARDPDALMLVQPQRPRRRRHRGLPSRRDAGHRRRPVRAARHVRRQADPARHRLRLHPGRRRARPASTACTTVDRFVEKPNRETAERFLADGNFLWNSGIFLLSARAYLDELARINPAMLARLRARDAGRRGGSRLLPPRPRRLRRGAVAVDRPRGDGAYQPRRRCAGRHGVERRRLVARAARHRQRRRGRQRAAGRRARREGHQLLHPQQRGPPGRRGRARQRGDRRHRRRRSGRRRRQRRAGLGPGHHARASAIAPSPTSTPPDTARGATTARSTPATASR